MVLAVAAAATGCGGGKPAARPNVVVIVIDTLRADKLGSQGGERGLTPGIDAFAGEGVLFERAFNHAPWTLPACASILSGLHPKEHGAGGQLPNFRALDASVPTLPKVFAAAGYVTHAIVNVAFLGKTFEVTRDFDSLDAEFYSSNVEVRPAGPTTDAALTWLDKRGEEPFFLFVHYFDPHAVYDPPQPFRRRFAAPPDREDESFVFGTRRHMEALRAGKLQLTPPIIRRAEALYDAEVAYTDSQVERLLDGLRERGLSDDTVVLLTGDHGEEFLDHGGFEHGHTVYDELCHIPLILRAPGLDPGRVGAVVRHVDIAPTLTELCRVPAAETFVGLSLLPLAQGEDEPGRSVLAHGNMWGPPRTSFRGERFKLITGGGAPPELYDWRADPGETEDLAGDQPDQVQRLEGVLKAVAGHMDALSRGGTADLSPQEAEALRGLGYGGGSDELAPDSSGDGGPQDPDKQR